MKTLLMKLNVNVLSYKLKNYDYNDNDLLNIIIDNINYDIENEKEITVPNSMFK